jgi:hypothetical protein
MGLSSSFIASYQAPALTRQTPGSSYKTLTPGYYQAPVLNPAPVPSDQAPVSSNLAQEDDDEYTGNPKI